MFLRVIEWLMNHLPLWLHLLPAVVLMLLCVLAARLPAWRPRLLKILPLLLFCSAVVGGALVGVLMGAIAASSIRCSGWLCSLGMVMEAVNGFAILGAAVGVSYLFSGWPSIRARALQHPLVWCLCALALMVYALAVYMVA